MNKTDEKLYYLNEMLMDFVEQEGFREEDILKSELVIELRNIIVVELLKVKGTEVVGSGLLKDIIRKTAEFHGIEGREVSEQDVEELRTSLIEAIEMHISTAK